MASTKPKPKAGTDTPNDGLGHLRDFGLEHVWQACFLLPNRWEDFTQPLESTADVRDGDSVVVAGWLCDRPSVSFAKKPPRTVIRMALQSGDLVRASFFGDVQKTIGALKAGDPLILAGVAKYINEAWWIGNPKVAKQAWRGRLRPVYPGKPGRMGADLVRTRILGMLRASIPDATKWLTERLSGQGDLSALLKQINSPTPDLQELFQWAHLPPTVGQGLRAQAAIEALAAADVLATIHTHRQSIPVDQAFLLSTLRARSLQVGPFRLTPDQCQAVKELATRLRGDVVSHSVLSGEVASGKTATYSIIAAAVADDLAARGEQAIVTIILPSQTLATQISQDIAGWFPDLSVALITGDTAPGTPKAQIIVGTTAVLNRDLPPTALLIIDEQHKLSTQQREQLRGPQTHFMEVSATCIPRTMALVQYGAIGVVQLRKGHAERDITTTLWGPTDQREVYSGVRQTVANGDRVLVIYPSIDTDASGNLQTSILDSLSRWEGQFPGLVRSMHSRMPVLAQTLALRELVTGRAQVLVSSTIVEVGVNIPKLRRVVVVYPDRFSANVLHQIRGRLAREGGVGHFDMLALGEIQPDTEARLNILVKHGDGFTVAEADLHQRGFGDIAIDGQRQSGLNDSFLFGRGVTPAHVAALAGKSD